jgi:ABC-2 type transport system permease protein
MTGWRAALWAESLKARRSMVPWLAAAGLSVAPLVGGLFMVILRDPEAARSMGLITSKAQLMAGSADWPSYLELVAQSVAVGGLLVFSLVTAWLFGREFDDGTAKELLAVPTTRSATVAAKFAVLAAWAALLSGFLVALSLAIGSLLQLPGGSGDVALQGSATLLVSAFLVLALMPPVALLASAGHGYLAPMGWAILTLVLAQVIAVTGWGSWFPWSVPALHSGLAGPRSLQLGPHSYVLVLAVLVAGTAATFRWWNYADHST